MPLSFQIFPDRAIVLVRYWGHITISESMRCFRSYAMHPDFRPGQRQVVDLRDVVSYDPSFVEMMAMQAEKVDTVLAGGQEAVFAFLAPTPPGYEVARQSMLSWGAAPQVIFRIFAEEAHLLEFLGQPEKSFAELIAARDAGRYESDLAPPSAELS